MTCEHDQKGPTKVTRFPDGQVMVESTCSKCGEVPVIADWSQASAEPDPVYRVKPRVRT